MRQPHLALVAAFALIIPFSLFATSHADTLSCTSVNGVTQCIGSGGLDCRTIEGRMVCAPGSKGHCDTEAGMMTCTNGRVRQSFKTASPSPARRNDESEK